MDVASKINYILTNLQQVSTLLPTVNAEDALAKQVFDQTAGQGGGLGAEFGMAGYLEYLTNKGLNDSKTTFPDTYLKETAYTFSIGVPIARSCMINS